MISEQEIERLTNILTKRIEQANVLFLQEIGKSVKKIGTLTPTKAHQLVQILRYGDTYESIIRKIAKLMEMNVKDIEKIFYEFAKKDQNFAKDFYRYRNKKFIPIGENKLLKEQVKALAKITQKEMINFSRTTAIGYSIRDKRGIQQFIGLKETYNRVLDEAILNVGQGKETFDSAMYRILKEIGGNGFKTLDFASGKSIRLDSMIRQNMQGALRNLHNELQTQFGEEFDGDGVEISVHLNPAPDHALVQGRQFSNEEFNKFQNDEDSTSYDGLFFPAESEETGRDRRSISEYNCYHYIFSIVLGVSKPNYTNNQLQEIIDKNEKGFEIDGKHYTMYEGTQLQRMLETQIRKNKDLQILGKASDNYFLVGESQNKINVLTQKYNELCHVSGLPPKKDRMRVSDYKRNRLGTKTYNDYIKKMQVGNFDITQYTDKIKSTTNQVIVTPKQKAHIFERHPDMKEFYNELPKIIQNPSNVYIENGKENTIWLTKEIDNRNIKVTMKLNKTTFYQRKQLGYKNSIIQMQELPKKRIQKYIEKGRIEEIFYKGK